MQEGRRSGKERASSKRTHAAGRCACTLMPDPETPARSDTQPSHTTIESSQFQRSPRYSSIPPASSLATISKVKTKVRATPRTWSATVFSSLPGFSNASPTAPMRMHARMKLLNLEEFTTACAPRCKMPPNQVLAMVDCKPKSLARKPFPLDEQSPRQRLCASTCSSSSAALCSTSRGDLRSISTPSSRQSMIASDVISALACLSRGSGGGGGFLPTRDCHMGPVQFVTGSAVCCCKGPLHRLAMGACSSSKAGSAGGAPGVRAGAGCHRARSRPPGRLHTSSFPRRERKGGQGGKDTPDEARVSLVECR